MKKPTIFLTLLAAIVLTSWSNVAEKKEALTNEKAISTYEEIQLNDLSEFNLVSKNWKIAGGVNVDRTKKRTFDSKKGTGVLLNSPKKNKKGHLFTAFEHGDMELELDVMMPNGML